MMNQGYKRGPIGPTCSGMRRTEVDFVQKYPDGFQRNPHWKVYPETKYQPLNYGPVDFYPDSRRLDRYNGVLFQQYRDDWQGCGNSRELFMSNDEKNRYDLQYVGLVQPRRELDDMYHPRFGRNTNPAPTERRFDRPNPFFSQIYGGPEWLDTDRIGSGR